MCSDFSSRPVASAVSEHTLQRKRVVGLREMILQFRSQNFQRWEVKAHGDIF